MPLEPVGPVMVIAEVIPKALAPEVLSPEVDRLMVAAPPAVRLASNTMVSAPGYVFSSLALSMASRREPTPASPVFRTVKVAGTTLCSRLRSSSRGEKEALRAFLFCELVKSLRKAFKSMESVLYKSLKKK